MNTHVEHGLVIPPGTTKNIIRIRSDDSGAPDFIIGGLTGGFLGMITTFMTIPVPPTMEGIFLTLGAGAIAGIATVVTGIQRVNIWSETQGEISKQVKDSSQKMVNPLRTRRTIKEHRQIFHVKKNPEDSTEDTKEVHLVTNFKGVWVETVTQKSHASMWDDSIKSVVTLYSIDTSQKKPKGKVSA